MIFSSRLPDLLQRGLPRLQFGCNFTLAFRMAFAAQAEPPHDPGQHRALADQRHDDDAEGHEQDHVAVRKWRAADHRVGNGERHGERVDAAHPGKGQEKGRLPAWRRIALAQMRTEPARDIGRGKNPDEARRNRDQRRQDGRDHQFADAEGVALLDQCAGLQAGKQKHQALDQVDDQVPEKNSLQPRGGRDQPRSDPTHVKPAGNGGQNTGAAEIGRHPEGKIGCQHRQRYFDARLMRPSPHAQAEPTDREAVNDLADDDRHESAGGLSSENAPVLTATTANR